MKMNIRLLLVASVALSASLISCKKDKEATTATDSTSIAIQSDDQSRFSSGTDDVTNDANDVASNFGAFNGKVEGVADLPCNATAVLDSTPTLRRITVIYNGNNCYNTRNRVGTVVLTMPLGQRWGDQGAVLTIETQNLKITRLSDSKSIKINGSMAITNVTGGRVITLSSGTIIHDIASSGITVTFDDNTQRNWQVSKRRTFSYNNGIVMTTEGTHTEGSNTHISEWGTNRFGNAFTASITEPMIIRQDCNFRLTHGEITHDGVLGTAVVTFGLDSSGAPTGCPGLGVYYFKAVWTGVNGIVRTVIYPY